MASKAKTVEGVLKMVRHADGTGTSLHVCKMTRPGKDGVRRSQWTWIVGMGVDAQGTAKEGGNCCPSLASALECFDRVVAYKGGAVRVLAGDELANA